MAPTRPMPQLRRLAAGMAGRRTNLAILVLLLAAVATGALNFALGTGWVAWPTIAHGVVGAALLLVTGWKWRIVRRGLETRPARSTWPSVVLGVLVVAALVSGLLHATGLVLRYGPLDDMQVHVGSALLSLPLAAWHVLARGTVPERSDLTRRNLLASALLIGSAGAVYAAAEASITAAGLRGAQRRRSGSFEDGSHDPTSMPAIIWLFDPRLELAADAWSLEVVDRAGMRRWTLRDLRTATARAPDRVTATLDCTSGWYAQQDWHGVLLARLLGDVPADARSVVVTSQTGYARRFPRRDLDHLLLATGYEGRALAPRHGFPARLVAPGRRGFWWVKWVTRIVLDDRPWWAQPPYPLQ